VSVVREGSDNRVNEERVVALDPAKFDGLLSARHGDDFAAALAVARRKLAGRTWWHIDSTAQGGGVAEMLQSVLCYVPSRGAV
jgi:trehalose synthase